MHSILLIEDDENFASTVSRLLEDEGYNVTHIGASESVEEIVDYILGEAETHQFDCIITDLQLQKYNYDSIRDLRVPNAVAQYKEIYNSCWITLSGATPDEAKRIQMEYPQIDGHVNKRRFVVALLDLLTQLSGN